MRLITETIKSIASREVYSNEWSAPFCDSILIYKKDMYSHTHPEWHTQEKELLQDCDLSDKYEQYATPYKITFIKFTERGFHIPQNKKCVYISLDEINTVHMSKHDSMHILGELDKVRATPSWKSDLWNKKQISTHELTKNEVFIAGNIVASCIYPITGNSFIQVEYE